MAQETFTAAHINSTRANFAIKSEAAVKKIFSVLTVKIEALKAKADSQCWDALRDRVISSQGHRYTSGAMASYLLMECVVRTLLYWKNMTMLTWSHDEPAGYRTCFKLNEPEN